MDSNDLKIASDAQVYKKIMLPKPNGKPTNLQIIYVANTSIFWNGFNMKFERMSVNQITRFAYEPDIVTWWVAVSGLCFFLFMFIVFYKNCFGFNLCLGGKKFHEEDEDDVFVEC